jgi:hypothetical protein
MLNLEDLHLRERSWPGAPRGRASGPWRKGPCGSSGGGGGGRAMRAELAAEGRARGGQGVGTRAPPACGLLPQSEGGGAARSRLQPPLRPCACRGGGPRETIRFEALAAAALVAQGLARYRTRAPGMRAANVAAAAAARAATPTPRGCQPGPHPRRRRRRRRRRQPPPRRRGGAPAAADNGSTAMAAVSQTRSKQSYQ